MNILRTFSAGLQIGAAWLNLMQTLGVAQRSSTIGDLNAMADGLECRVWQGAADLADGALVAVDNTVITIIDPISDPIATTAGSVAWTDRLVLGVFRGYAAANQRVGQSDDHLFDAAGPPTLFLGYTGAGAKDAGNANVTAGNPPVPATGASWAILITTGLWLYVDPADGQMKLYNATGSSIRTPLLWFFATGDTGKR